MEVDKASPENRWQTMNKEDIDWQSLSKQERRKLKRDLKKKERKRQNIVGKLRAWVVAITVTVVLTTTGYYWITNRQVLPPKGSLGHIESSPPSHILDRPMGTTIQMHMLEHADGGGPPGVIINYNCDNFECENNLVDQLTEIAQQYPEFVYLAPYPGMTKKLAITREGKIETFDSFDKEGLVSFIQNR